MLTEYVDGNQEARTAVNAWIGPGSDVDLSDEIISGFFSIVLGTTAELSKNP
jgi:hypothetical protein